jgi:hypothetical protein
MENQTAAPEIRQPLFALRMLRKKLGEMPIQQVIILLATMDEEGITKKTIGDENQMNAQKVSRNAKKLSDEDPRFDLYRRPIKGLLFAERDAEIHQRHALYLTNEGKRLKKRLEAVLDIAKHDYAEMKSLGVVQI